MLQSMTLKHHLFRQNLCKQSDSKVIYGKFFGISLYFSNLIRFIYRASREIKSFNLEIKLKEVILHA